MRTAISLVLAVLAGLLAALALAGARLEALVYTPGPVQEIAGPMAEEPELVGELPDTVAGLVQEELPGSIPSFLQDGVTELVRGATDGLVTDDRFDDAWASVIEQSRQDWVDRLAEIHAEGQAADAGAAAGRNAEPAPETSANPAGAAGTLHLQLAPLGELAVDRLAESVESFPGGTAAAEALREGAEQAAQNAAADGSTALTVDVGIPDPDTVPAERVATVVSWLPQWPWLAGGAVLSALLALLVAPRGRSWMVLVAAGLTAALAGLAGRWGLESLQVGEAAGLARVAADSLIHGVRDYAVPDTWTLIIGGVLVAGLGVVAGLFSRRGAARG